MTSDPTNDPQRLAMNKAIRFLSRRQHSRGELRRKLLDRDFPSYIVNNVLDECQRLGFINDRDFATAYLAELQQRGAGHNKCRAAMLAKGLPSELVNEMLHNSTNPDDELARAQQALARKRPSLSRETDPRKHRQKAIRFLLSRGFSLPTATRAYNTPESS